MKTKFFRPFISFCILLSILLSSPQLALATVSAAQDISGKSLVTSYAGFSDSKYLFDGITSYGVDAFAAGGQDAYLLLENSEGIGSVYLLFEENGPFTVTDPATDESFQAGTNGFYHEFVDLTALFGYAPKAVRLSFPNLPVEILELYAFTEGEVPDFVQKWKLPADGETDLLLLSAHGDDEQLFFGGLLPYYAGELGYQVQVIYMVRHRSEPYRVHEMLNGLWAVGVDTYPVFGDFDDFRVKDYDLDFAYETYALYGQTKEMLLGFVVEQLRRFDPLVAVTHDFNGEYGHSQHMVCADLMTQALIAATDPEMFPESADQYGLWDVPKAYFHLYEENPVVMDWDQPLESFGGMTAFQVTQELGFPCHESQYDIFEDYFSESGLATDVELYNPCYYGLYRSTVGEDVAKNDFFENLLTHTQQAEKESEDARLAAEAESLAAQQAAEEESRAQEQAIEESRLAEEAARESEEARRESEAQAALEAEQQRLTQEEAEAQKQKLLLFIGIGSGAALCLVLILCIFLSRKRRKKKGGKFLKK